MDLTKVKKLTNLKTRAFYGIFGFLLGIAPLAEGIAPFGCALLCAMPKKWRREAFFGVAVASFFDECLPLALFCALYLFLVLSAKEKNGGVQLHTRILLSFSISALRTAYIAISGIEFMPDAFRILTAIISYPAFTFAFMGYFDNKKELCKGRYDLSLLAFAFSLCVLFSGFEVGNVCLAFLPAAFFTLAAARTRGFAFGGVCGIVCGLVSGGSAVGALGVMGISYGLLLGESEAFAMALSFMLALMGHFYLSGSYGFFAAALMLAAVYCLFLPIRKRLAVCSPVEAKTEKRAHDRRISRYAAAFSSLSSLFYTVSDKTREESITDVNEKIVENVSYFCDRCQGCKLDKSEISNFFTSELRNYGIAAYSRIPSHIISQCPNACAMAKAVNKIGETKARESEKGLKQMAEEYSAISALLVDAAKKQEEGAKTDKPLADRIFRALKEMGIECDGVKVKGTRTRDVTIFGIFPDKITKTSNEIGGIVSAIIGTAVSQPEIVFHDDYALMKIRSVPSLRIEFSKISEAKTGETVCGDTVSVFENDENFFYCLVSDGMGSGRDAALTSRLSAIMMEKLLTVGAEKESALRLLNKALTEKQEEVFATVDLLEIDRIMSSATLIKAGAAPTILIRKGRSALLEAKTPPAGIMQRVIADKKTFKLEKGDMLVMLSDGILQTGSESSILPREGIPPMPSAHALASKILRDARKTARCSDDMSVCVLRLF